MAFTYEIKWNPPQGNGYIVQYVEVKDQLELVHGYTEPY